MAAMDSLSSDAAIPRAGVAFAGLARFASAVALHAPGGTTAGLSTDDVNRLAMAHLTRARRCAYSDLLENEGAGATDEGGAAAVGEATIFVSHAWAMPFDELVDALRGVDAAARARSARPPFFWIDLLVNDQWAAPSRSFEWWRTVFAESVARIGHTVVVLEWQRPLPLGRIWCLFEIFCSSTGSEARSDLEDQDAENEGNSAGAAAAATPCAPTRPPALLELALPSASHAAFARALVDDFSSIGAKLCRIDLRGADAFHGGSGPGRCSALAGGCPAVAAAQACPDDKAHIMGAIERAPGGIDGVTKRIIGGLRDWMYRAAFTELAGIADADARASSTLQSNLGLLLQFTGRLHEAEPLLREALDARRRLLGDASDSTIAAVNQLGRLLRARGRLDEAEPLLREALEARRRKFGAAHRDTQISMSNVGQLLKAQGKYDEAASLFLEALDIGRATLGDSDIHSLLVAITNVGKIHLAKGDLEAAEPLLREALLTSSRVLGTQHPSFFFAQSNLGRLLQEREEWAEAEALFRAALTSRRRGLGDQHNNTLASVADLGKLLLARGALAEAAPLLREALESRRRTLGENHAHTRASREDLDRLLRAERTPE